MKKVLYIVFAAVALVATSCQMEMGPLGPADPDQGLILKFSCGDMVTKAPVNGDNNENLVKYIDYFIFPLNSEEKVEDDTEYAYKGERFIPGEGHGLDGSYEVTIQPGKLAEIFPDGATKAVVFAVANYVDKDGGNPSIDSPITTIPDDVKTWRALHNLEVGSTFFYDDLNPDFQLRWPRRMNPDCDSLFFVMVADSVVVDLHTSGLYAIDATIPLKRLASKVTVSFTYESVREEKESGTIVWIPQPGDDESRVFLSNAIEHTTLGGPLTRELVDDSWGTATKPLGNGTRDIFEYAYDFMNDITATDDDGNKLAHYYTYPIKMDAGDDNQPYIKHVLLWYGYKWLGEGDAPEEFDMENPGWDSYKQKEVYYKITLPYDSVGESNRIYEYSVNVNIVGSDKEVNIQGEYEVLNWYTKDPVSSNVATGRYISLDIPKDEYDMYVDEIDIAFVSSGTVIPIVKEIYQWNYSGSTPTKDYFMQNDVVTTDTDLLNRKGFTAAQVEQWVTIPDETSYVKINHAMCNDINVNPISKFDAAPYVYVVTLHLEAAGDDTSFDRTITITQYPAMFIQAETNSAYGTSDNYGYVYINNQQNTTQNNWYLVSGLTGTNSNPNMFVITSTILSDPNMILGDPRTSAVQNGYSSNDNSWSPVANNMYTASTRRLTYYYPTDNSDAAKQIVSPKFRIASSYGKTYPVSREGAFDRCAAYQEDGYPAGRWRIPTSAEVAYVVNLSANGFMDVLFGNPRTSDTDTNYWTASGYITVNNYTNTVTPHDGNTTGNVYVRCVYDDWYWTDKAPDKTSFIWGDKLR